MAQRTDQTLTFVSHTHWDREWYQTFQQYRIRLVQLVDKLLDLLESTPDYKYFMLDGQTIILDDYLEIRPERRATLAAHISAGRLQIGPWHILPDEFLVSPESTIRNLLVGAATCAQFGKRMDVGNIPDPFGHISQMPQILRGFDIDAMTFWRGVSGVQNEFRWAAPDGTEILVIHQQHGYGNAADMPTEPEMFVERTKQIVEQLTPTATTRHLLAMNGSDHVEPQPELPRLLENADAALPNVEIRHGTLPQFVAAVRAAAPELETRSGEMRDPAKAPLLPGVLSARMWIKQRNCASETLLTRWAEPASALAELAQAPLELTGQSALVKRAWRYLLENHPHDSICGCSIDQVHREMATRFDWVDQIGEEITSRSLQALADLVDTPNDPALVVFNPTTHQRTDVVSTRIPIPEDATSVILEAADGHSLTPSLSSRQREVLWDFEMAAKEMQGMIGYLSQSKVVGYDLHEIIPTLIGDTLDLEIKVGRGVTADPAGLQRSRGELHALMENDDVRMVHVVVHRGDLADCTFVAGAVPGLGYRSYRIRPADRIRPGDRIRPAQTPTPDEEPGDDNAIENEHLRVQVAEDGTFSVIDKATGILYTGLNRFVDVGDRGDEYNFCPVETDVTVAAAVAPPEVRRIAHGPVCQTLEVAQLYRIPVGLGKTRLERSAENVDLPITSRISLITGLPRVEVETTVDNGASDHRLRAHFPVPVTVDTFDAEGHMDVITRDLDLPTETDDWVEQPIGTHPQCTWSDVSDGETGLLLANRGLPEVEVLRTETGSELALTLLRCVGWLSRGDLSVRQGHAGPGLPTPEAQCPGTHTFHYALVPHRGDWSQAYLQADAFSAPFRALTTGAHVGALPPTQSFCEVSPAALVVSAVKQAEDGEGLIVRLWNIQAEACQATLRFWHPPVAVKRCNLAERVLETLAITEADTVGFSVGGREIVTLRVQIGAEQRGGTP
jgi:mannosylglycerate hydrolase